MTDLNSYFQDGACRQARAVLCLLQGMSVEESWDDQFHRYRAEPKVARWENCREQGYVVMLRAENGKNLNIAWFEHRNSDSICALRWEQVAFPNSPNIDTADFGKACYSDKWDVNKQVSCGHISEMSEWITGELQAFWLSNREEVKA